MPPRSRLPLRSRSVPRGLAIGALFGLSWGGIAGCSSPSRGPEVDVVEVERIEVLPKETPAPSAPSDDATHAPAEEVPTAPAAE